VFRWIYHPHLPALATIVLPMDRSMMYRIGLTGGIASGKSTVAHLFAQHGIGIIDADLIAREIVLPGQSAYKAIVAHFGENILEDHGNINRIKLKEIVFNHKEERLWLEKLLHPLIRNEMIARSNKVPSPYCIEVIPLLIETLPYPELNRILVVDVSVDTQIKRLKEREKLEDTLIKEILTAQISREERLSHADDVIENEGDLSSLTQAVNRLHQRYLQYCSAT